MSLSSKIRWHIKRYHDEKKSTWLTAEQTEKILGVPWRRVLDFAEHNYRGFWLPTGSPPYQFIFEESLVEYLRKSERLRTPPDPRETAM